MSPVACAYLQICFVDLWRGWFISIESGLGPDDLCSILARSFGFHREITLSKLCTYAFSQANQAIHPFGVAKLVRDIYRVNSALRSVR